MTDHPENPPAFPRPGFEQCAGMQDGMSLRDYFAAAALTNPSICTGTAQDYQLDAWFGRHRCGITRAQIAARQALDYADAMLRERCK